MFWKSVPVPKIKKLKIKFFIFSKYLIKYLTNLFLEECPRPQNIKNKLKLKPKNQKPKNQNQARWNQAK